MDLRISRIISELFGVLCHSGHFFNFGSFGHLDTWTYGHFDSTDRLGDVTVNRDKGTPNPKLSVTRPEGSTRKFNFEYQYYG